LCADEHRIAKVKIKKSASVFLFALDSTFGSGLLDDLLGDLAGHLVVVGELPTVRAARQTSVNLI
jgi:hypothetical protein